MTCLSPTTPMPELESFSRPSSRPIPIGPTSRPIPIGLPFLLLLIAITAPAGAQYPLDEGPLEIWGQAWVQGLDVNGSSSWREGGLGRLDPDGALARADLILDWHPSTALADSLSFYLHATARAESEAFEGDAVGIVEAYADIEWNLRTADRLRLRAGHFILPTSQSNTDLGWSSRYTLGFSAIDTWIGEEVRPTGLAASYNRAIGSIDEIELGSSVFWNNDTAGTLLAWRGWAFSDRLTTFGEVLPLPNLPELDETGAFGEQRDDGSRPFGADLDGRAGWAGWLRYRRPEHFTVQWSHYDNRGDREIHEGEYAWRTRFDLWGADFHRGPLGLMAEWMEGSTGMGIRSGPNVQMDFRSTYVLASWSWEYWRLSTRWEEFESWDRDGSVELDLNQGDGTALTLALLWESPSQPLRIGLEWLDVDGERPIGAVTGLGAETGGESWKLEIRWYFDS